MRRWSLPLAVMLTALWAGAALAQGGSTPPAQDAASMNVWVALAPILAAATAVERTLEAVFNFVESTGLRLHIELRERGMVELLVASPRGAHRRFTTLRESVVAVETVLVQDRECRVAPRAAELSFGALLEEARRHRRRTVRAEHRRVFCRSFRRGEAKGVSGHERCADDRTVTRVP